MPLLDESAVPYVGAFAALAVVSGLLHIKQRAERTDNFTGADRSATGVAGSMPRQGAPAVGRLRRSANSQPTSVRSSGSSSASTGQ